MKVTVTQDDIDNGVALNGSQCPIARAVKRATDSELAKFAKSIPCHLKGLVTDVPVNVMEDDIEISSGRDMKVNGCKLKVSPTVRKRAGKFIKAFDKGVAVRPFSFEVRC